LVHIRHAETGHWQSSFEQNGAKGKGSAR